MKTAVSAHARVRVFFTSCCFSLTLSLNETARRIKTPVVHVRCDLTTHSTTLSHVGILAMLSWNFTGNVLSNCRLFDYLIYNFTSNSTDMLNVGTLLPFYGISTHRHLDVMSGEMCFKLYQTIQTNN